MTAPNPDDLERRLTELFQQRASTVTRARPVDFGSNSGKDGRTSPAGPRQVRLGTYRQNLGVLAAAAAVFVAIAATVLGIQSNRHQPAPPLSTGSHPVSTPAASPTGTPSGTLYEKACPAPASWRQAITAGAFAVDRSLNTVVSANGATGDYLVVQGNQPPPGTSAAYSDVELALFRGKTGRTIYTPAKSSDIPVADPTGGAITADWIAFAVTRPQNLGYTYKVMLYDRGSGSSSTLAELTEQQSLRGRVFIGSPVIAAGKVYWLAAAFNKPASTTLDSWDLARDASAGSVPAANATALISYGSGMVISYGGGMPDGALSQPTEIRNGAGRPLTQLQLSWMSRGTNFGFDGASKLSWMSHDDGVGGYEDLVVGGDGINSEGLVWQSPGIRPVIYPFVEVRLDDADPAAGQNAVADVRTNRAVALPGGVEFQAVIGDKIVFGTGATKSGAAGLSIVALSALEPVYCERP
jgi:hypothetical protein